MLQNKERFFTRAGLGLALVFLFLGNRATAKSRYNLQITGGYSISDEWDMNGYNVDLRDCNKIT